MIQTAPFKDERAGRNVNLLKHTVDYPAHAFLDQEVRIVRQVVWSSVVHRHEGSLAIRVRRQSKFVHITARHGAGSLDLRDYAVVSVHDRAVTARETLMLLTLVEAYMVLALVFANVWIVGGLGSALRRRRPNKILQPGQSLCRQRYG